MERCKTAFNLMWQCERETGHIGDHRYATGGVVIVWPVGPHEPSADPTPQGRELELEVNNDDHPTCRELKNGFLCTRKTGHIGDHVATNVAGNVIYERWSDAPAPQPEPVVEAKPAVKQTCGNCRFADTLVARNAYCRRYPPQVISGGDNDDYASSPLVLMSGWCGEWKEKEDG